MDASLAIQLEQMVALMFILVFLVVVKIAMAWLKDYAVYVYKLTILVEGGK